MGASGGMTGVLLERHWSSWAQNTKIRQPQTGEFLMEYLGKIAISLECSLTSRAARYHLDYIRRAPNKLSGLLSISIPA